MSLENGHGEPMDPQRESRERLEAFETGARQLQELMETALKSPNLPPAGEGN